MIIWNICAKYLYRIFLLNISIELLFRIFLINYVINSGDTDKEHTDGKDSDNSSHTVGYIVLSDKDNDDLQSSDDEPLSKYVKKRSDLTKKKQVMLLNLGHEDGHVAKPVQRLLNLYLW